MKLGSLERLLQKPAVILVFVVLFTNASTLSTAAPKPGEPKNERRPAGASSTENPNRTLNVSVRLLEKSGGRTKAEVELQNPGTEAVTAYEIAITITDSNGREAVSNFSEDLLHLIGIADSFPDATFPGDGGLLGPGQTRTYKLDIGDGPEGAVPLRASGKAIGLIYKDRSAVGDPNFIDSEFTMRSQRAADMAAVMAEMEKVLSDSEIHSATAEPKNFPSAEKKFRQKLGPRIEQMRQGTPAERRQGDDLRLYFYDQYPSGGPLLVIKHALDSYRAQQAAYETGAKRKEAK